MSGKKGFTLIEIIVVLVILAIIAAMAIPNYLINEEEGAAKTAQNNLITIYTAERNFYLTNTASVGTGAPAWYCTTSTQNTTCADNLTDLDNGLSLNISDNFFNYSCTDPLSGSDSNDGSAFSCTATNKTDNTFTLTVTNNGKPSIVLLGGSGCATQAGASCNPNCTYVTHPNYCPGIAN